MDCSSIQKETYVYHFDSSPIELDVASYSSSLNNMNTNKTFVFFHGGGLISGSRRSRFPTLPVDLLMQRGWLVVVPDYRLLPEANIADIIDVSKHLEEWILRDGPKLGIDVDAVAVGGSSAGIF
jgi:acetyl esterase